MKKSGGSREKLNDASFQGNVTVTINEGVARLCFSHPKANCFPAQLLERLACELENSAKASNVKVIVLSSEGSGAFSAGASFDEFKLLSNNIEAKEFFSGFARVLLAIVRSPKFVICQVQGKAVGGGVGLIAACDYTIALSSAQVRLSEVELGIGPFVVAAAIERRVGAAAFQAMTIDSEWRNAKWCEERGLFAKVVDSKEDLERGVSNLATKLSSIPIETAAELKRLFTSETEDWGSMLAERAATCGRLLIKHGVGGAGRKTPYG